jgi:3-hydroxymyristoyl/3-hydroxydecanoyl-(acyl carrier protein) dehydratase
MINRLPDIISHSPSSDGAAYQLFIPDSLAWFDGHFPGELILPAVVQVDWAIYFGQRLGFDPDRFAGFSRLKFMSVIQPNMQLRLDLVVAGTNLDFVYESAAGVHSKGTVNFRLEGADV